MSGDRGVGEKDFDGDEAGPVVGVGQGEVNLLAAVDGDGVGEVLVGLHLEGVVVGGMHIHGGWLAVHDVGVGGGPCIRGLEVPIGSVKRNHEGFRGGELLAKSAGLGFGRNYFGLLFGGRWVEDDAGEGGGFECELIAGMEVLRPDVRSAEEMIDADGQREVKPREERDRCEDQGNAVEDVRACGVDLSGVGTRIGGLPGEDARENNEEEAGKGDLVEEPEEEGELRGDGDGNDPVEVAPGRCGKAGEVGWGVELAYGGLDG